MKSRFLIPVFAVLALSLTVVREAPAAIDAGDAPKGMRRKVIDFEDDVVEGVNKRPLDSLSQISEKDGRKKKPHLYRKRAGFRNETLQTIRDLRYTP